MSLESSLKGAQWRNVYEKERSAILRIVNGQLSWDPDDLRTTLEDRIMTKVHREALRATKAARPARGALYANIVGTLPATSQHSAEERQRIFWKKGWLHLMTLEPTLLEKLLAVSQHYLPTISSGTKVHGDPKGCRTNGWIPPEETEASFWNDRKGQGGTFHTKKDDTSTAAIQELITLFKAAIGREDVDMKVTVDFMLSWEGQKPQEWHQDATSTVLAAIVYLDEKSAGTEYAAYDGCDFMKSHNPLKFLRETAWKAITAEGTFLKDRVSWTAALLFFRTRPMCTANHRLRKAYKRQPGRGGRRSIPLAH